MSIFGEALDSQCEVMDVVSGGRGYPISTEKAMRLPAHSWWCMQERTAGWWRWWGESTQGPAVERCGEGPPEEPHGPFTASGGGGESQVKEQRLSASWFDSLEV